MADKRKSSAKGKGSSKKSKGELTAEPIDVSINEDYVSQEFKQLFSKFWKGETDNLAGE